VYAVISDRDRQYGVRVGDVILCDVSDAWTEGTEVTFDQVHLLSNEGDVRVGKPTVGGASVRGEVVGSARGEKLVVFKFKRRKGARCKRGHRQSYAKVRITGIDA